MVKRDKRNIGKRVRLLTDDPRWAGREGTVHGFRGNDIREQDGRRTYVPRVWVKLDGTGMYSFAGDKLEYVR